MSGLYSKAKDGFICISGISRNAVLNRMHYDCKETLQALLINTKFRKCKMLLIIHAQNELESCDTGRMGWG